MHDAFPDPILAYWKKHALATVRDAFATYARLADCVVVLSPRDGAPRLVKRSEAAERLASEGYPSFLFRIDLGVVEEPDELCFVWKDNGGAHAEKLRVGRDEHEPPTPIALDPFTAPAFKAPDDAWIGALADTIGALQAQVRAAIVASEDDPRAYMIFWALLTARPVLFPREGAKAALGNHPRWKEILGHVYMPHDDVLVLGEINGKLVPFVRRTREPG